MTIGNKIVLAFGVPVAFTVVVSVMSIALMRHMNETVQQLAASSLPGINSVGRLAGVAKDIRGGIRGHITAANADAKLKAEGDLAQLERTAQAELRSYEATISDPRDRALFSQVPDALNRLVKSAGAILPLSREAHAEEAMGLFRSETMPAYLNAQRAIENLAEFKQEDGNRRAAAAAAANLRARLWMGTMLALSLAASGAIGWFLSRQIRVVLARAVRTLNSASEQLSAATGQIADSSEALARNTSEQAAALEETSASSGEIQSLAERNAEYSKSAAHKIEDTARRLDTANSAVQAMVASMEGISASSQKISKIIEVIDGIAFQTNILALNAAVEAARAGESGLGFSVVADEVRALAQRAAQAARDSASVIAESMVRSTAGKGQLDQIAGAIQFLAQDARSMKELIRRVETASEEQTRGIEQVSKAIVRMERATQHTAATAEENASAAREMSAQSEGLKEIVESLYTLVATEESGDLNGSARARRG